MEKKDEWDSVGLHVNLTFEEAEIIDLAIKNGDARNASQAIGKALDLWGRDREEHHMHRKPMMREIAAENLKRRAALNEMQNTVKQLARK